ncbi:uncharacterized protein LOC122813975 isoform X2 [Protopterus annectens]|uniref:uncharacterized protein LOC122813975 isoform X2 n=1 Tax=Protopterus annectens TaxID=7888 RepID=UPI001CFA03D1|nr:uncharacterized protein LOC122813975 isoform X2 [Protopterus annectens]
MVTIHLSIFLSAACVFSHEMNAEYITKQESETIILSCGPARNISNKEEVSWKRSNEHETVANLTIEAKTDFIKFVEIIWGPDSFYLKVENWSGDCTLIKCRDENGTEITTYRANITGNGSLVEVEVSYSDKPVCNNTEIFCNGTSNPDMTLTLKRSSHKIRTDQKLFLIFKNYRFFLAFSLTSADFGRYICRHNNGIHIITVALMGWWEIFIKNRYWLIAVGILIYFVVSVFFVVIYLCIQRRKARKQKLRRITECRSVINGTRIQMANNYTASSQAQTPNGTAVDEEDNISYENVEETKASIQFCASVSKANEGDDGDSYENISDIDTKKEDSNSEDYEMPDETQMTTANVNDPETQSQDSADYESPDEGQENDTREEPDGQTAESDDEDSYENMGKLAEEGKSDDEASYEDMGKMGNNDLSDDEDSYEQMGKMAEDNISKDSPSYEDIDESFNASEKNTELQPHMEKEESDDDADSYENMDCSFYGENKESEVPYTEHPKDECYVEFDSEASVTPTGMTVTESRTNRYKDEDWKHYKTAADEKGTRKASCTGWNVN